VEVSLSLHPKAQRHFWPEEVRESRKVLLTSRTKLGTATAWHQNLSEACWRVTKTLENVEMRDKMYRTDLLPQIEGVVKDLLVRGVI
jgi:hypothetical protein